MNVESHLKCIIKDEQLSALFQPIYSTTFEKAYGFEALIRGPSDSPLHSPNALFDAALQYGLLSELELVCRKISIARFVELDLQGKLFLNVSPMVLLQSDHSQGVTISYLNEYNLSPDKVVIELSEKYPIDSPELLKNALIYYRNLGFSIAVDDLGAGYAGLKLWSEVTPDFVKIDRYFINQCHHDPVKREFIKSILNLGKNINANVIAEGIETHDEFDCLNELGLSLYQGYLFARPEPFPQQTLPSILEFKQRLVNVPVDIEPLASSLLQPANTINHDELTKDVVDYLHKHPHVHSIPVIRGRAPIGMALRGLLLELFSTPYGRALNEQKVISETMAKNPVIVEANTPLSEVARMVTSEHDEKIQWHFIITDRSNYVGIASVRDLLRQLTQQQIQHARYSNPLTMLPGNVPIYRHVDELLAAKVSFRFAYFDLNNFKPYNDIYGYAKGDQVIQLVSTILQHYCAKTDFVGHIGGDDFVVVFQDEQWRERCEAILREFDEKILEFYEPGHINAGGIETKSRTGQSQFFPLLGLAVGVVEPASTRCASHHDVAEVASAAKKQAKLTVKSSIFVCKRGGPNLDATISAIAV
ncbi:EAL domain-containing protein [Thalassotalea sp. PLHSN55]|uniref:EAL domain-containing protein n=1 Tax=Thalassotalea sp. PLHSN55 TaxID=3435888 RepID=UPI003F850343